MQKLGWFGAVKGHSWSAAMLPFDRAHTTSYSTLIETMGPIYKNVLRQSYDYLTIMQSYDLLTTDVL